MHCRVSNDPGQRRDSRHTVQEPVERQQGPRETVPRRFPALGRRPYRILSGGAPGHRDEPA